MSDRIPCIRNQACHPTNCSHTCRYVSTQAAAKGYTRDSLLSALPYENRSKAAARLDELSFDLSDRNDLFQTALTDLLELDPQQLNWVLVADRQALWTAEVEKWRKTFKPYAKAILTTQRPRSIAMAGAAGAGRFLLVDLSSVVPEHYHTFTLQTFRDEGRVRMLKAFFYDPVGFQIAFTPDYSEFFTWEGAYIASKWDGRPSHQLPVTEG